METNVGQENVYQPVKQGHAKIMAVILSVVFVLILLAGLALFVTQRNLMQNQIVQLQQQIASLQSRPQETVATTTALPVLPTSVPSDSPTNVASLNPANQADCKALAYQHVGQFVNDNTAYISSPISDFNQHLNACLMQITIFYPDHGGYSEDVTILNLATNETILKGSNATTYLNEAGGYYVDPVPKNIIIDANKFNSQAKQLSKFFGGISFDPKDFPTY